MSVKPHSWAFCLGLLACNGSVTLGTLGTDDSLENDPTATPEPASSRRPSPASDAVGQTRSCESFLEVTPAAAYPPVSYSARVVRQPEFHFLAVYEAQPTANHELGTITVHVERPGRHVLYLYAYEPTDWTLDVAPDATLERVEVYGYHAQRVLGLPDSNVAGVHQVVDGAPRIPPLEPSCGYLPGCNVEGYAQSLQSAYGYPVTSFGGAYSAGELRLKRDPAECLSYGEPLACTLLYQGSDMSLATLLLPENQLTLGSRLLLRPPINAMGKRGGDLFVCNRTDSGGTVTRVDARTGAVEHSTVACEAVTADGSAIWVHDGRASSLGRYDDWAAVRAGSGVRAAFAAPVSRLAVQGQTLFGAWHSTQIIERMTLAGASQGSVALEGYDDWVLGLAVAPDGRLIVAAPDRVGSLLTFDSATGKRYESFPKPVLDATSGDSYGEYQAIVCEPR